MVSKWAKSGPVAGPKVGHKWDSKWPLAGPLVGCFETRIEPADGHWVAQKWAINRTTLCWGGQRPGREWVSGWSKDGPLGGPKVGHK